jgi:hypothetical protein
MLKRLEQELYLGEVIREVPDAGFAMFG